MKNNEIVLLDLFSGIGGFALGLHLEGFKITKHYFSEKDKNCIDNYRYNFPNSEYVGTVTDIQPKQLQRPNIITFGSPCQDFSLAGKRLGMEGERSSLISEAIRIVDASRPDVFIWENVKGAFSSNDSEDFWSIVQAFANIGGYSIEWQLLNTSWVLPQNRERIYLVGHLTGRSRLGVFPITESDSGHNERESNSSIVRTLTAGAKSGGHHSGMTLIKEDVSLLYWKGSKDKWVNENKEITPTLKCQQDNNRSTLIVKSATKTGFEVANNGDSINLTNPNSKTRRGRVGVGVAQTLDTQCMQGVFINQINSKQNFGKSTKQQDRVYGTNEIMACLGSNRTDDKTKILVAQRGGRHENDPQHLEQRKDDNANTLTSAAKDNMIAEGSTIRRLTEIECERLQGFPDDWTRYGDYDGIVKQVAKTNRYKMCGNAVNVATFTQVAKRLKDCMIW